jgi:hypothetical protein
MDKAKRARTAETPKQPSLGLKLRAPYFYPDPRDSTFSTETPDAATPSMSAVLQLRRNFVRPSERRDVPRRPEQVQQTEQAYSITSSARASSDGGGTVRPSIRAVSALITRRQEPWYTPMP